MDPTDYVLHTNPPRAPSHYDPVHAASGSSWEQHPQGSPAYQWNMNPYPAGAPLPFGFQRPHHSPEHFQLGQNGGLPPPGAGIRGMPGPDALAGLPAPTRHWGHPLHQMPGAGGVPGPAPGPANHMSVPPEATFGSVQPPAGRGLGFHGVPRTAAQSVGTAGVTSERNSQPRWPFSSPAPSANAFGGQENAPSHAFTPPSLPFSSSPHRHTSHRSTSSSTRRSPPAVFPPPSFSNHSGRPVQPAAGTERRRPGHTRNRRSMTSRVYTSDSPRDVDDDHPRAVTFETPPPEEGRRSGGHAPHRATMNDSDVRQMQMMRGLASGKMVASKTTLRSLQSVRIEDLPANERTCVICYNEYGIETPEGVSEAPLQLPRCKHVFGDHCIKKWFEDSDSCPYCRDKLHSEPKRHGCSARAFINAMRIRGLSDSTQEELWARAMAHSTHPLEMDIFAGLPPVQMPERRAPPSDGGEEPRRTRARRSNSVARAPSPPPTEDEARAMADQYMATLQRRIQWIAASETGHRRSVSQIYPPEAAAPDLAEARASGPSSSALRSAHGRSQRTPRSHDEGQGTWNHPFPDEQLPNPLQSVPMGVGGTPPNADPLMMGGVGAGDRPTGSRAESAGRNHRPNRPW